MTDSEYDLTVSKKAVGALYPILKDAHGAIIDGFHRNNADPNWPSITIGTVDNPVKLELARLAANSCRRVIPATEMTQRIGFLVEAGLKADEIAEKTGLSKTTIYKYMPQELKNGVKAEAGSVGGSAPRAEQTVKTQEPPQGLVKPIITQRQDMMKEIVIADCGHQTHTSHIQVLDGRKLCRICYDRLFKLPKAELHSPKPQSPMQMTKWADRVEMMKVQHSQQETDLIKELVGLGVTPETDQTVPLWWTIPDGLYREKKVCYYVHGPPHDKGKATEKDEEIKAALERLGWNVLVFRHGEGTVKEWAVQVQEALRF